MVRVVHDAQMFSNGSSTEGPMNPSPSFRGYPAPHEIFDPESSRRVLVDHAFIVAGGEITKAARSWLGNALDASRRSQSLFMGPRRHSEPLHRHQPVSSPRRPAHRRPDPWLTGSDELPF